MERLTTETIISDYSTETSDYFDVRSTILASIETLIDGVSNVNKAVIPDEQTPPSHKAPLLLYDVLIPMLGTLIILLNLAVVISSGLILKKGQQPRSTYMFLGNVALTDLVTGIAVLFGQFYPKKHRNHYVCATQIGMIVSSTLASIYSVGLIAIDRYLFILHGLKYQTWVYPTRVRVFILTTWIIGCVIGYLPLMGWYGDTDNGRVCWFILIAPKELILLTCIIGVIPILVVIVLYSIILYRALRRIIQMQGADASNNGINENGLRIFRGKANVSNVEESPKGDSNADKQKSQYNANSPSKWKAIKVVMFTTGSFIITWSPYFVASLMYGYCYDKDSPRCNTLRILIASPLAILGFTNSLLNPIIYAWWHKGFRTFIKNKVQTIKLKRKLTREITAPDSTTTSSMTGNTGLGSKTSSSSNFQSIQLETDNDSYNTRL